MENDKLMFAGRGSDFFQYVQTSNGNVAFHPNGSLVIKSVNQGDEGFYRCEVQNGVGEISKTIFLDVEGTIHFRNCFLWKMRTCSFCSSSLL